jgi:hypothetical protein
MRKGMTRNDFKPMLVLQELKDVKLSPLDAFSALEEACHLIVQMRWNLHELQSSIRQAMMESYIKDVRSNDNS